MIWSLKWRSCAPARSRATWCIPTCAAVMARKKSSTQMRTKGECMGIFPVESRALINLLPRSRPKTFYDLGIEVAIVRPGPIQGDRVHPYLRRRHGEEKIEYPDARVEKVLSRTLGIPI